MKSEIFGNVFSMIYINFMIHILHISIRFTELNKTILAHFAKIFIV